MNVEEVRKLQALNAQAMKQEVVEDKDPQTAVLKRVQALVKVGMHFTIVKLLRVLNAQDASAVGVQALVNCLYYMACHTEVRGHLIQGGALKVLEAAAATGNKHCPESRPGEYRVGKLTNKVLSRGQTRRACGTMFGCVQGKRAPNCSSRLILPLFRRRSMWGLFRAC